jgi:hydroxymethylpyrimidine/phosphomethylpyrimidine kinase
VNPAPPVILCIGGHDPCGGAGIQADIETGGALGCHVATVVACLTVQDTVNLSESQPVDPALVVRQARAVLHDLPVRAIKLGLLGSAEVARAVATVVDDAHGVPVVLDPVLAAGGGTDLGSPDLIAALREAVLPRAALATPNSPEARRLAGCETLADCATGLLATGCAAVLVTGGHEPGERLVSRLFRPGVAEARFESRRLPGAFRGTGCTLATAIAAGLAHGQSLDAAVHAAHDYTHAAVAAAVRLGRGQRLLRRTVRP